MDFKQLLITIAFVIGNSQLSAQKLTVSNYKISFSIKNAGLTVDGQFKGLKYDLFWDTNKPENSKIGASVKVATLNTGIDLRDDHLLADSYFDEKRYPEISLKSISIKIIDKEKGKFVGTFLLSIKGDERTIDLPFTYSEKTFKTTFEIDRRDFGVGGNSFTMSDTVKIEILINAS